MNETNTNKDSRVAKALCVVIDNINKVIPVNTLSSINCLYTWLDSHSNLNEYVHSDYYNGSEDDITNIFIEILKLATSDHCFNGNYVLKRLEFLANEGLHVSEIFNSKNPSFKVTPDEADEIIKKYAKKTKKTTKKNLKKAVEFYRENVKSSVNLNPIKKKKPVKRLMRDNKGRFIKNK